MKFFRNIRKDTIKSKGAIRYLSYSIGEIILVVIGILIAVALNNYNEKRKESKELDNIFTIVKTNLQSDIQSVNKVQEYYKAKKNLFDLVLNDSLSKEDYIKDDRLKRLILGYPEISFDKRGLNLLSAYNSKVRSSNDTLAAYIVNFYNERLLEIKADDNFRASEFNDNFYHWKKNYVWWASYVRLKNDDGFINYALTDPDYKNRVATFYFINYNVFLPELQVFEDKAIVIINAIEERELK